MRLGVPTHLPFPLRLVFFQKTLGQDHFLIVILGVKESFVAYIFDHSAPGKGFFHAGVLSCLYEITSLMGQCTGSFRYE